MEKMVSQKLLTFRHPQASPLQLLLAGLFVCLIVLAKQSSNGRPPMIQLTQASQITSQQPSPHLLQDMAAAASQPPAPVSAQTSINPAPSAAGQQPKLPKINIYINKHEIRKLLGINERINYVTNGNLNTYPLGFTIPLGYNQSDIIFTWQNLGQTNVNYSISLVIGNIHAVDPPLINITRSGQIPKQEQVFKITLPCSGKVTAEVDVQVLINIVGFVAPDEDLQQQQGGPSASNAAGSQTGTSGGQQELLGPATAVAAAAAAANNADASPPGSMQSDQPATSIAPSSSVASSSPSGRLVSHQLAIKRKKICTQHPVVVVMPPTSQHRQQQQQNNIMAPPPSIVESGQHINMNRWSPFTPQAATATTTKQTTTQSDPTILAKQANHFDQTAHPMMQVVDASPPQQPPNELPNENEPSRKFDPSASGGPSHGQAQEPQAASGAARRTQVITEPTRPFLSFYPNWPAAQEQHQQPLIGLGGGSKILSAAAAAAPTSPQMPMSILAPPSPIPDDNPLNSFINRPPAHQPSQPQPSGSSTGSGIAFGSNNPLVLSLIALSLLISVALVVVVILGSSSSSSSSGHRNPLEKLNTLTSCLLRRAPASSHGHASNKCKSPMASAVLNSLRAAGPKSSSGPSAVSGLSAISGHSKSYGHSAVLMNGGGGGTNFCYKTTSNYSNPTASYYTNSNQYQQSGHPHQQQQQQQHLYQQPPTADLLGTGYQSCQPISSQQQAPPPPQYPISHLNSGNASQMTRLIWNNGNGTSPDGFIIDGGSYLPSHHSNNNNAPISDTGSVYQTIY